MSSHPPGSYPLVFESGVLTLDEDGTLHVHLSHSPEAPHPLVTHPDGEETTIPAEVSEASITGSKEAVIRMRGSFREAETLPEGFVFHLRGWQLMQLEMSGDLTILFTDLDEVPDWFQPGRVHRFDGPEDGVRVYRESREIEETRSAPPRQAPKPSAAPAGGTAAERQMGSQTSEKGCLPMLLLLGLSGLLASLPLWV